MKKLLLLPILLLLTLSSALAVFPIDNLIGYWDFREGNQTSFSNLMGTGENIEVSGTPNVINNSIFNSVFINNDNNSFNNLFNKNFSLVIVGNIDEGSVNARFPIRFLDKDEGIAGADGIGFRYETSFGGRYRRVIEGSGNNLCSSCSSQLTNSLITMGYINTNSSSNPMYLDIRSDERNMSENLNIAPSLDEYILLQIFSGLPASINQILVFDKSINETEINYIYENQDDDFLLIGGLTIEDETVQGNIFNNQYYKEELNFSIEFSGNNTPLNTCQITIDGNNTFQNMTITENTCYKELNPQQDINYSILISDDDETIQTSFKTLQYDNIAPTTNSTINDTQNTNGWYNKNLEITLTSNDNKSGVNNTLYCLGTDCTPNTEYSTPLIIEDEGTTTIRYRSVDNLGNTENTQQEIIQLDKTPPITTKTIIGNLENNTYTSSVIISLNAIDLTSGVNNTQWCSGNNCSNFQEYNQEIELLISGEYTIRFYSEDNAGNNENITTINLTLDVIPTTVTPPPAVIQPPSLDDRLLSFNLLNTANQIILVLLLVIAMFFYLVRAYLISAILFFIPGILLLANGYNIIVSSILLIIGVLLIIASNENK